MMGKILAMSFPNKANPAIKKTHATEIPVKESFTSFSSAIEISVTRPAFTNAPPMPPTIIES